jgi:hypothetical protein
MSTMVVRYVDGNSAGDDLYNTITTPLVDITGATLLTKIDAELTGTHSGTFSIGGSVTIMGMKAISDCGFYKQQTWSPGVNPATSGVLAVATNGATKVICTSPSIYVYKNAFSPQPHSGTLSVYGTFNNGVGEKLLATMVTDFSFFYLTSSLTLRGWNTVVTPPVDITGATLLTEIRAVLSPGYEFDSALILGSMVLMGINS